MVEGNPWSGARKRFPFYSRNNSATRSNYAAGSDLNHATGPGIVVACELTNHPAPGGRRHVPRPGPQAKDATPWHETPVAERPQVSRSDTAPVAHQPPDWTNGRLAQAVGGCRHPGKPWQDRPP